MKWKLAVMPLLVSASVLTAIVAHTGSQARAVGPLTLADLINQCAATVGTDGFGSATIDRDLVINGQTGTLSTPCVLHLSNGAQISINSAHLTTHHLYVTDDGPGTRSSSIQVNGSTLTGNGEAGFFIRLRHAADRTNVNGSTIDYSLSVWIVVSGIGSGTDAGGGTIDANGSTFRSNGLQTQGIRMMTDPKTGTGNFVSDNFQTTYSEGQALLLAGTCNKVSVVGAPQYCSLPHR